MKYNTTALTAIKALHSATIKTVSILLLTIGFSSLPARAQLFNPSTSSEVTFPSAPVGPLALSGAPATSFPLYPIAYAQVPGLYCNAHASNAGSLPGDPPSPTDYVAETAAWTVDNGAGWEDGFVSYGYTTGAGVYIPVDTLQIHGAKHLSAAYMLDASGANAYIMVAYTVRHANYNQDPLNPCVWTLGAGYGYAQEYRIYTWPVITGAATFARMGRISNVSAGISPVWNYDPACHPLYIPPFSLWSMDFAYDGNLVMDVSLDAKRVAFAWTGNGGGVQLSVANINSATNPPTLNLSLPEPIGAAAARDPLDVAFRRDPILPSGFDLYSDFIHVLINDGLNNYYVTQNEYNDIMTGGGGFTQLWDDATYMTTPPFGPMWTGTNPGGGRSDHMKLDVPDQSSQRRWAYTFTDGQSVFLRRFVAPTSLSPSSAIGSSSFQIINNGFLVDVMGNTIDACNTSRNVKAAIAHKANTNNIYLSWLSDATISAPVGMGGSGFSNAISLELQELAPWPAPMRAVSAQDYLHVQTTTFGAAAREYVALSHHSATTHNYLYNTFTADDGVDNYLLHKNHDMAVSSTWRTTPQSAIEQALSGISAGPNPFTDVVRIQAAGTLSVQLSDISGRSIAAYEGTDAAVNARLSSTTTQLAAGTYLLSVQNDAGEKQVFKLNKQ